MHVERRDMPISRDAAEPDGLVIVRRQDGQGMKNEIPERRGLRIARPDVDLLGVVVAGRQSPHRYRIQVAQLRDVHRIGDAQSDI